MFFPCHGKKRYLFFANAKQTCCRLFGGAYRKISDGKQNCVFQFLQERGNARKLYTCCCIGESFFMPFTTDRQGGNIRTHVVRAILKPFLNYFPNFKTAPSGNTACRTLLISRKKICVKCPPACLCSKEQEKLSVYSSLSLSLSSGALPLLSRIAFWHVPKAARSV